MRDVLLPHIRSEGIDCEGLRAESDVIMMSQDLPRVLREMFKGVGKQCY